MNIVVIVGTRPNFMKAFPVYEALKKFFKLTLIHTGQHFDDKMSKIFFDELKFPKPDIFLQLKKKTKAGDFDEKLYVNNELYLQNKDQVINDLLQYNGDLGQIGEIKSKLEIEFTKLKPSLVILFGDVTSTLASALIAMKMNIDVAHIESGLRSFDLRMPEEVNRILTDHISKYYFVTEKSGVINLNNENIFDNIYLVGNTMIDTQKKFIMKALDTNFHSSLGLIKKDYVLITLHRPSNVDNVEKLKIIMHDLIKLSENIKIVYPMHPRTKKTLKLLPCHKEINKNPNFIICDALGYLEFTCLIANSKYVITDSGGVQEETSTLDISCYTLRENTERPSTLITNEGTNQLIKKISDIDFQQYYGNMKLWDGKSRFKILNVLNRILIKN